MASETFAIGPAPARESYLNQDLIIDILKQSHADGLHPGYGFLSENAGFAQRVIVFDRARGRVIYDDVMHASLSMPVPDMFFVRDEHLFYIKERRTIRAVRVGREP